MEAADQPDGDIDATLTRFNRALSTFSLFTRITSLTLEFNIALLTSDVFLHVSNLSRLQRLEICCGYTNCNANPADAVSMRSLSFEPLKRLKKLHI